MLSDLLYRARALFRRKRMEDDLDAELRFHLDRLTEQHVRTGKSPGESLRLARVALGGLSQIKEQCRDSWGVTWIDALARDLRYAVVRIRRYPRSAVVIGGSLALGITANTLMFSIFSASRNPTHLAGIHELVQIYESNYQGLRSPVSVPDFRDLKQVQRSLVGIAAYGTRIFNLSDHQRNPELVDGALVSLDLFRVLAIQPILGRTFAETDFRLGAPGTVIISHHFWQSRFLARTDVLGLSLIINATPHAIVGVMPAKFAFPFSSSVWLPWTDLSVDNRRHASSLQVVGRLPREADIERAKVELSAIMARSERERAVFVMPLYDALTGGGRMQTLVSLLLVAATFLLLVVCLNVASIRSTHALSRQRETATYLVLGASRGQVIQRFLTESLLVALVGGAFGILGAHWAIRYVTARFETEIPFWMDITLDESTLAFTAGLSLLVGIVSGLQPALQCSRSPLTAIKEGLSGSRRTTTLLQLFVLVQIAAAVLLLVGAKTAIDGLRSLLSRDLGITLDETRATSIQLLSDRYGSSQSRKLATTRLIENVRSMPGIEKVAAVDPMPLKDNWNTTRLAIDSDLPRAADMNRVQVADYLCTPNYFSMIGSPLLAGDSFPDGRGGTARPAAIVNRGLAQFLWGDDLSNAVGESIRVMDQPYEVIGVAGDSYHDPRASRPPLAVYRQFRADPPKRFSLLVDSQLSPEVLLGQLQAAVGKFDSALAVSGPESMQSLLDESISTTRASTHTFAVTSVVALILALMGVFGMAASLVTERSRELAIRRALGSSTTMAASLVLRQIAELTAIGLLVGTVGSLPMVGLLRSGFHGISEYPVMSYVSAWSAVGFTSVLAASFGALRVLQRRPVEELGT
ncbi:MAG: ABC transporter permease [Bryobacterales bacterium]|nr:ABC transporter permease [Bryobacterales bacterium]